MFLRALFFLMQRAVVFWRAAVSRTWKQMSVCSKPSFVKLSKNCAERSQGRAAKPGGRVAKPGCGSRGVQSAGSSVLPSASFQGVFLLGTDTAKSPAPTQMFLQQLWSNAARRIPCHTQGFAVHLSLLRGLATDEIKRLEKHEMRGFIWYLVSAGVSGELPRLSAALLYTAATFCRANSW